MAAALSGNIRSSIAFWNIRSSCGLMVSEYTQLTYLSYFMTWRSGIYAANLLSRNLLSLNFIPLLIYLYLYFEINMCVMTYTFLNLNTGTR